MDLSDEKLRELLKLEEWKPVLNYEDRYAVSNMGRVKKTSKKKNDIKGQGYMLSRRGNNRGYPSVILSRYKQYKIKLVHVLMMESFCGPKAKGMTVNHKDGIKDNNFIGNLEYMTQKENINHADRLGLRKYVGGEKHGFSKFTEKEVLEMRKLRSYGCRTKTLMNKFNISEVHLSAIVNRRFWKHI